MTLSPSNPSAPGLILPALKALRAGRIADHISAEVALFGEDPQGASKVYGAYGCLGAALVWTCLALCVLPFGQDHFIVGALALFNALGGAISFWSVRSYGDPRRGAGVTLLLTVLASMALGFESVSPLYAILACSPSIACIGLTVRSIALRSAAVIVTFGAICLVGAVATEPGAGRRIGEVAVFGQIAAISIAQAFIVLAATAAANALARELALEQLKQAHGQLREATDRSQQALDVARVGLWEIAEGQPRRVSICPSFTNITGYTPEDIHAISDNLQQIVHPDDLRGFQEALRESVMRRSRVRFDLRIKTKLRGYRWFAIRARLGPPDAQSVFISGSIQDIHLMKSAADALRAGRDRAREADRAKSDFIAIMSHEVRTPLNAILGSVAVMKRGRHTQETRDLLNLAEEAGHGLLAVVNDLLDVSRINAGKLEVETAPTEIGSLVSRCVEAWRPQANDRGLDLIMHSRGQTGLSLRVDAARIRQIIGNVVSNAIKFTDMGSVTVSLAVSPLGANAAEVVVDVIDTGRGVPGSLQLGLFTPFERARDTGGGAGLGLYISRSLARLMGGDLTLEETSAAGTRFRLRLPAGLAGAHIAPPPEAPDPEWTGAQILCVDDNEANRRIAALILAQFGATPTLSASGADALEKCRSSAFDAILMDIVMPDLDGLQTLAQLRAMGGPNATTPVIALTARLSSEDVASYHAAGFAGVAAKPIDIRELAELLAPCIPKSGAWAA